MNNINLALQKLFASPTWKYILAGAVYIILLLYSYAFLINDPYLGFQLERNFVVNHIFTHNPDQTPQVGDRILRVDSVDLTDARVFSDNRIFNDFSHGGRYEMLIQRGDERIQFNWTVPGPTSDEILNRISVVWIPYLFWVIGLISIILLRPRDLRWGLLVSFLFITSIWLMAGLPENKDFLRASTITKMAMWISVPIYLHFHYIFPKPLGRINPTIIGIAHTGLLILVILEWYKITPVVAALIACALAFLISLIMLVIQAILRPEYRRDLNILWLALALSIAPLILIGITQSLEILPIYPQLIIFTFPLIPVAYFMIIYRRQLGGMELRINRALTIYVFAILLMITVLPLGFVAQNWFSNFNLSIIFDAWLIVLMIIIAIVVYPRFKNWFETRILGIPLPLDQTVENFTSHISASLDTKRLSHLLQDEVFPSLLIRQAALLRVNEMDKNGQSRHVEVVFSKGVQASNLPTPSEVSSLIKRSGIHITNPSGDNETSPSTSWVRLALPMQVNGENTGVFLFGRRDPDDYYASAEIQSLQAIVNQTALALANIEQGKNLRALYRNDIERQEIERKNLARDLHDDVLGQLALLAQSVDDNLVSPQFSDAYQTSVNHIREIISGLRPALLNYGLRAAVDELVDELSPGSTLAIREMPIIEIDIPPSRIRYPPDVELHLYRIIQQACQNTLRHANAAHLCLSGHLVIDDVELTVQDDGDGFNTSDHLDLTSLLTKKQFGLAGMYERAALIGAKLDINSVQPGGTIVSITWNIDDTNLPPP